MILKRFKQIISLVAAAVVIVAGLTIVVWMAEKGRPNVEVVFLDVGQGDSILIKTKYNQQILIDGGPDANILGRLGRQLPFFDRSLDLVIATHPDADHIAGLIPVVERYRVGLFLEPGIKHQTSLSAELKRIIEEKNIPVRLAGSRQIYELGDNMFLDILHPIQSFVGMDLKDTNSASIVARLSDGEVDYLFTGDAPAEVELKLASQYGSALKSEILKLGHHGSKTSSSESFLNTVGPEVAVVQVGKDNRYGHPSPAIIRRLGQMDIPVLRTDELGDIRLESDGETCFFR